jgi:hypothetical protein
MAKNSNNKILMSILIFIAIIVVSLLSLPSKTKNLSQNFASNNNPNLINSKPTKTTNCQEKNGFPDENCTPGATNLKVNQDNIKQTICVSGYTSTIRPPESYTENLKIQQIKAYGYSDTKLSDYEEDHFIPLEIGGSPDSAANLWPEPYQNPFGSYEKDGVENYLHSQVCSGKMTLSDAQNQIVANWETIYNENF